MNQAHRSKGTFKEKERDQKDQVTVPILTKNIQHRNTTMPHAVCRPYIGHVMRGIVVWGHIDKCDRNGDDYHNRNAPWQTTPPQASFFGQKCC